MTASEQRGTLFVSCGEISGDLYADAFIRSFLKQAPDFRGRVWGMLGPRGEAACGPRDEGLPLWSYEELKLMGLVEVLPALPRILRLRRNMVREVMARRPEAAVLIDSPDFHLPLASAFRKAGYRGKLICLVPPTVWAWRSGRTRTLKQYFDLSLPLFPFEHEFLRKKGVPSLWQVHPLAESMKGCRVSEAFRERFKGSRVVALMPGSRRYDVRYHLEVLIGTAGLLREAGYRPVFSSAPGLSKPLAEEIRVRAQARGFDVWEGEGRELMAGSLAVAGVSGTVAVEAMLLGRYMVVIYRVSRLSRLVLRALLHIPCISIPNCLTDEPVYPELLCRDAVPEKIVSALFRYLDDPALREATDRRLARAREAMGTGNAPDFWARSVLDLLCAPGGTETRGKNLDGKAEKLTEGERR